MLSGICTALRSVRKIVYGAFYASCKCLRNDSKIMFTKPVTERLCDYLTCYGTVSSTAKSDNCSRNWS